MDRKLELIKQIEDSLHLLKSNITESNVDKICNSYNNIEINTGMTPIL